MILRSLKLENIRSYKTTMIAFPKGISLFEGDIGSGKSTILMAIEFALFGLGSQKGGSLLKTNESKGSVSHLPSTVMSISFAVRSCEKAATSNKGRDTSKGRTA